MPSPFAPAAVAAFPFVYFPDALVLASALTTLFFKSLDETTGFLATSVALPAVADFLIGSADLDVALLPLYDCLFSPTTCFEDFLPWFFFSAYFLIVVVLVNPFLPTARVFYTVIFWLADFYEF